MAELPDYHDEEYQYPNRIQLIPVDEPNKIYDVDRVPGRGIEGTPLNKEFFDNFKKWFELRTEQVKTKLSTHTEEQIRHFDEVYGLQGDKFLENERRREELFDGLQLRRDSAFNMEYERQSQEFTRDQENRNERFETLVDHLRTESEMLNQRHATLYGMMMDVRNELYDQQERNNSEQAANNAAARSVTIKKLNPSEVDSKGLPIGRGKTGVIYLVPDKNNEGNKFSEYIYIGDSWEKIGDSAASFEPITSDMITTAINDHKGVVGNEVLTANQLLALGEAMTGLIYEHANDMFDSAKSDLERSISTVSDDLDYYIKEQARDEEIREQRENDLMVGINGKISNLQSDVAMLRRGHTHKANDISDFKSAVLNMFYPVGTIYTTMDTRFNPATSFGGSWKKISDRFLYATNGTTGITGGEKEHKLTIDEMPEHRHRFDTHPRDSDEDSAYKYTRAGTGAYIGFDTTYSTGGDKPHNNMPPYITVHAWQRTA